MKPMAVGCCVMMIGERSKEEADGHREGADHRPTISKVEGCTPQARGRSRRRIGVDRQTRRPVQSPSQIARSRARLGGCPHRQLSSQVKHMGERRRGRVIGPARHKGLTPPRHSTCTQAAEGGSDAELLKPGTRRLSTASTFESGTTAGAAAVVLTSSLRTSLGATVRSGPAARSIDPATTQVRSINRVRSVELAGGVLMSLPSRPLYFSIEHPTPGPNAHTYINTYINIHIPITQKHEQPGTKKWAPSTLP